jgi:hypothetical protein
VVRLSHKNILVALYHNRLKQTKIMTYLLNILKQVGCHVEENGTPHELNEKLHSHLNRLWKAPPRTRHCVAPTPVQLTRASMGWLHKELYMVAPKTDGMRLFILFAGFPVPTITCFNRAREFVHIRGDAPAEFFRQSGTLLDGELLSDGRYFIFDVICSKGCTMMQRNYMERMMEVRRLLSGPLDLPGLGPRAKKVFALTDIKQMMREMERDVGVPSDGILLTPVNCRITMGSNHMMFKLKYKPTVDLLFGHDENNLRTLSWSTENGNKLIEPLENYGLYLDRREHHGQAKNNSGVQEFEVYMSSDKNSIRLRWLRTRVGEKTRPNFYRTVQSIYAEVLEGITLAEVAEFATKIDVTSITGAMPSSAVRQLHGSGEEQESFEVLAHEKKDVFTYPQNQSKDKAKQDKQPDKFCRPAKKQRVRSKGKAQTKLKMKSKPKLAQKTKNILSVSAFPMTLSKEVIKLLSGAKFKPYVPSEKYLGPAEDAKPLSSSVVSGGSITLLQMLIADIQADSK